MMEDKAKQMHQTLLLRQETRNEFRITNTQSHPGVWKPQCCVQQSHNECPNMKYSKGQNLVWHRQHLDSWAQWFVAAGALHTAGHPFPRDPATWAGPPGTVSAKASFQQHRANLSVHGSSSQHQHQHGTEFITPSPFSTVALPEPAVIPSSFLCGTAWDTARRFQLQEAAVWSPKKDPKNPTPQTIQKCRLHTLSTTSTFIGNILPIQYGNGDTCFHEAVLVLESTQRATFHEEDGIVLDCLN